VLGLKATGSKAAIAPHQRWATGLLSDSCQVPNIDYQDRGVQGTGQGWAMGFGVVWNSTGTNEVLVQKPPLATNWAIGTFGKYVTAAEPNLIVPSGTLPDGTTDLRNAAVAPSSLYAAQLCLRLGSGAMSAIGYPK
jgi:hypothetical protein